MEEREGSDNSGMEERGGFDDVRMEEGGLRRWQDGGRKGSDSGKIEEGKRGTDQLWDTGGMGWRGRKGGLEGEGGLDADERRMRGGNKRE
ncbi:hypothetical protein COCNU_scaffold008395G000010 [Cocos nucifera]|nr:hypothetical protein [Cocos nucifera]